MRWLATRLAAGLMAGSALAAGGAGLAPQSPQTPPQTPPQTQLLDDFHNPAAWQASASDQVGSRISQDATGAMCLHYDFGRVAGYAVARRALPLNLPEHYTFTLRLRGQGAGNAFQIKWVDASGDNVWWRNLPNFVPPAKALDLAIRQRQIEFAWGPADDKVLRRPAALELVVASGQGGGAGQLCFERLTLQTLPAPAAPTAPVITQGTEGSTLDLGSAQEFNGLLWRWAGPGQGMTRQAQSADVLLSDDGQHWRQALRVRQSRRDWQAVWLPDQAARYVRIKALGSAAATELQALAPSVWPDQNALLMALAAHAPRSHHPRALHGEQNYWTLVGVDGGGDHAALISEDGAIEPRRAGPSVEPVVIDGQGRVMGWAEVQAEGRSSTTLQEGHLPLPQVEWQHPRFGLTVEAGASGDRQQAQLIARYTVHNPTSQRQTLTLALLVQPWQVNPPQQFLNTPGGVAELRQVSWRGRTLHVNGQAWLQALEPPNTVLAAAFDSGDVLAVGGKNLHAQALIDPQALASARLSWPLNLAPGERRSVTISLPLIGSATPPANATDAQAQLGAVATAWRTRLNRVRFTLPPEALTMHHSLRVALSHILMSRAGPALQPGTRSYARSWIRDGAMMVAGLLRLGEQDAAREFVRWYAGQLFANGKVPCCVDQRGADPVAENDSHGQFIFAVAELWRHTQDRALLQSLWPQVDAAARYQEQLRQSERSAPNRQPGREAFWGLMPASISHEGYSAKPMHSYWDNFWALAGWRDAVLLARAVGDEKRANELLAQHDEFKRELGKSLATSMAQHHITHLPGAAELGDFDATSSTMIFSPAGAEQLVPPEVLIATWQRYWEEAQRRIAAATAAPAGLPTATPLASTPVAAAALPAAAIWHEYTPYELRSVSALTRLGQPERAHAMLDFFHHDQRPAGWHHWAEVVDRQPRHPRFIGDMPHAWISSDYIRSALDLLAYERDSDHALVLAAGVPLAWLQSGPVGVQGLRTAYGELGYALTLQDGQAKLVLTPGLSDPPGGLWLAWQGQLHRVPAGQTELVVKVGQAAVN